MKKDQADTVIAVSGLIGYLLMRFSLPALQVERLIVLTIFSLTSLLLMFTYRREKQKKRVANPAPLEKTEKEKG